jgi:predicted nucleotidyltransferase
MVDAAIIQSVQRYLRALNERGLPVQYAVLFGSYARNQPHSWSDIDVMVVSEQFDDQPKREDVRLLWRVAARVDSLIEPIPVGRRQYESGSGIAIVEVARREGHIIPNERSETQRP